MAANLGIEGTEEELIEMFGIGCWKYDPEAATKLFQKAGLELRDDGWYFNDAPFVLNLTYLAETEQQAGRGVQAAYDQLLKFGFTCNIFSESSSTWTANDSTGNYYIAGYWPTQFITRDIYGAISQYDADLITPLGETGIGGNGMRWNNERATEIIHELAQISPDSDEAYELGLEFVKVAIRICRSSVSTRASSSFRRTARFGKAIRARTIRTMVRGGGGAASSTSSRT